MINRSLYAQTIQQIRFKINRNKVGSSPSGLT